MDPFGQILGVEIRIATLRYHMSALENGERTLLQRINVPLTSIERDCLTAITIQHEKIRTELRELCELIAEMPAENDVYNPDLVITRVRTRNQITSDRPSRNIGSDILATLSPKIIIQSCQKIFMRLPRQKKVVGLKAIFKKRK